MSPDERSASEREMNDLNTAIAELQAGERKGIETANEVIRQRDALSQQHRQLNSGLRTLQAEIDAKSIRRNELQQAIKNHDNAERKRKNDEAKAKRQSDEAKAAEAAAKANQPVEEQAESGKGE